MATRKPTPRSTEKTKAEAVAAPAKTAPAVTEQASKVRQKLVRDSFTIPKNEYALLDELKQRANRLDQPAKKSEILRAGISALTALSDKAFLAALSSVPSLKTGRPKAEADKTPAKKVKARPAAEATAGAH